MSYGTTELYIKLFYIYNRPHCDHKGYHQYLWFTTQRLCNNRHHIEDKTMSNQNCEILKSSNSTYDNVFVLCLGNIAWEKCSILLHI